jgi:protein phosphatase 1 regulatory subunit 37
VKHILHALLVSGSLPTLSLANNRKIKAKGWRFIAIFLRKVWSVARSESTPEDFTQAQALKFIDLSDNNLDRRAAEWLSQAIAPKQLSIEPELPSVAKPLPPLADASGQEAAPEGGLPTTNEVPRPHPTHHDSFDDHLMLTAPLLRGTLETGVPMPAALTSFRLENCNLRAQSLEAFAQAIRRSSVKHVSLRRNKITALGTVALAVMMRDYPVAADDQDISTARPTPLERDSIRGASGDSHSYPPLAGNSDGLLDADEEPSSDMAYIARTRLKLLKEIAVLPRVGHLLTLDVRSNDIKVGTCKLLSMRS